MAPFRPRVMANSRYAYVRRFEREPTLLPQTWAVVRLDGKGFTKFCDAHRFEKPNDAEGLDLMNAAAKGVMETFRDVRVAFGQSDEFSFVFHRAADLYGRRCYKWVSVVTSCFTGSYVHHWSTYFPQVPLQYPPCFDGRLVEYPSGQHVRDYLSWRQVDTHINNQYNTCFWALVQSGGHSPAEAQSMLKGTGKGEKNDLLFERFGINYNSLPEQFRKGSVLYRDAEGILQTEHTDLIQDSFWEAHPELLS